MRFGLSYDYPTNDIEEAPDAAAPTLISSAVLIFPQPLGVNGQGLPGRIVGKPSVLIAREYISASAYDWYWGYWVRQRDYGDTIHIRAYDPRTPTWSIFSCVMGYPTITPQARPRSEPTYVGFTCQFTNLVLVLAGP